MPVNQKPLSWIGIFWYQITPRKLLYLLVSLNLVKFGPHWLSVFFGATLYIDQGGSFIMPLGENPLQVVYCIMRTFRLEWRNTFQNKTHLHFKNFHSVESTTVNVNSKKDMRFDGTLFIFNFRGFVTKYSRMIYMFIYFSMHEYSGRTHY